jgi:ribonucleoside-diphosphate reductase alpha chain
MEAERLTIRTQAGYELQVRPNSTLLALDDGLEVVDLQARDVRIGQILPLPLGETSRMVPREVVLPVIDQCYYAGDQNVRVPDVLSPELAEAVGYFMGDGSLHAKGLRFCVANTDPDVVDALRAHGEALFGLNPAVTRAEGYWEVCYQSVRLARWWEAAGFAKVRPNHAHVGKGWTPHVPLALRESNNPAVLAPFLRGLYEADGTVLECVPSLSTSSATFAQEIRSLLLAFGLLTTTRTTRSGYGSNIYVIRLRNRDHAVRFKQSIGFMSARKSSLLAVENSPQAGNRDRIYLPRPVWEALVPSNADLRRLVISSLGKGCGVSRRTAEAVQAAYPVARLAEALRFGYEGVTAINKSAVS